MKISTRTWGISAALVIALLLAALAYLYQYNRNLEKSLASHRQSLAPVLGVLSTLGPQQLGDGKLAEDMRLSITALTMAMVSGPLPLDEFTGISLNGLCQLINGADRLFPPRPGQEVPKEGMDAVMTPMDRVLNRKLHLLAPELQAVRDARSKSYRQDECVLQNSSGIAPVPIQKQP